MQVCIDAAALSLPLSSRLSAQHPAALSTGVGACRADIWTANECFLMRNACETQPEQGWSLGLTSGRPNGNFSIAGGSDLSTSEGVSGQYLGSYSQKRHPELMGKPGQHCFFSPLPLCACFPRGDLLQR